MLPHRARTERRGRDRRVGLSARYTGPERRSGRERRVRTPGLLTPGLERGWLCFESDEDKRRLTPVPAGWDEAPEMELEGLLERAARVARRGAGSPEISHGGTEEPS